jgi:hypothetical protein
MVHGEAAEAARLAAAGQTVWFRVGWQPAVVEPAAAVVPFALAAALRAGHPAQADSAELIPAAAGAAFARKGA